MPRRENTFRVDYSQFPKQLSHDEIHKFIGKELGLTREHVRLLQPSRRLGCTFVEVINLELAEEIVSKHDNKHEFVYDGKAYKLRVMMEDGAVEVRLFDLSSDVSNEHIAEFLSEFGEILSIRDLLWDERSLFGGVKTGVRIARMVVKKNIPSLVTIGGEDTAVSYKGQRQTCLHCQEFVHVGIPCVQNKKLLAQKLTADQSYANVAKQPALLKKSAKPNNRPSEPQTQSNATRLNEPKPNETRPLQQSQVNTMAPPPTTSSMVQNALIAQPIIQLTPISATIGGFSSLRKTDGNETDNSQASRTSTSSRRSRGKRSPPGKKMRHSTINNDQDRASGDDLHL